MKRQVGWFLVIGSGGFLLDAGVTQILISLLGVPALLARLPAMALAVAFTFVFNRKHTFKAKDQCLLRGFRRYLVSTALAQSINFLIYSGIMLVLHVDYHHFAFLAVTTGSVCAASLTFILSKYWVFKSHD